MPELGGLALPEALGENGVVALSVVSAETQWKLHLQTLLVTVTACVGPVTHQAL